MTTTPDTTTNPRTIAGGRRAIAAAVAVVAASIALGGAVAGAQSDLPPWSHCSHTDHPPAADLGAILPVNVVPPPEALAVLRGEVAVGTDCSVYELPV